MSSLLPDQRQVNVRQQFEAVLAEAHTALLTASGARMSRLLAKDPDELLGRGLYARSGPSQRAVGHINPVRDRRFPAPAVSSLRVSRKLTRQLVRRQDITRPDRRVTHEVEGTRTTACDPYHI